MPRTAAAAAAAPPPLLLLSAAAAIAIAIAVAVAAPDGHLVASLPGFHGAFPSKHYSGCVSCRAPPLFSSLII
jgi:hypothetical protein